MKIQHFERLARTTALAVAGAVVLSLAWTPDAAAEISCDDAGLQFPCDLQIESVELAEVPIRFKFQARVSQAKLPIGQGSFNTIYVKLKTGTQVLCLEEFVDVDVVDSVLNLSIGESMTCEVDQVIAENGDLSFQVCLGSLNNCLKSVDLGTVPYAVKATYAKTAGNAHEANVAGQAHYAHRVTADRDLFIRNTLGSGYFDFYTHTHSDGGNGLYGTAQEYAEFADGGFIQWTPVRAPGDAGSPGAFNLHIVGKQQDTDALRQLDTLVIAADETEALGELMVRGSAELRTDSPVFRIHAATGLPVMKFSTTGGSRPATTLGWLDESFGLDVGGVRTLEIDQQGLATLHGDVVMTGDAGPMRLTLVADSESAGSSLPSLAFQTGASGGADAFIGYSGDGLIFDTNADGTAEIDVTDELVTVTPAAVLASTASVGGLLTATGGISSPGAGFTVDVEEAIVRAADCAVVGPQGNTANVCQPGTDGGSAYTRRLEVFGGAKIHGPLDVTGTISIPADSVDLSDYVQLVESNDVQLLNDLVVGGTLSVSNATTITNSVDTASLRILDGDAITVAGFGSTLVVGADFDAVEVAGGAEVGDLRVTSTGGAARLKAEGSTSAWTKWQTTNQAFAGFFGGSNFEIRAGAVDVASRALIIDAADDHVTKVAIPAGLNIGSDVPADVGTLKLRVAGDAQVLNQMLVGGGTVGQGGKLDVRVQPVASESQTAAHGIRVWNGNADEGDVVLGVTSGAAFIESHNGQPLVVLADTTSFGSEVFAVGAEADVAVTFYSTDNDLEAVFRGDANATLILQADDDNTGSARPSLQVMQVDDDHGPGVPEGLELRLDADEGILSARHDASASATRTNVLKFGVDDDNFGDITGGTLKDYIDDAIGAVDDKLDYFDGTNNDKITVDGGRVESILVTDCTGSHTYSPTFGNAYAETPVVIGQLLETRSNGDPDDNFIVITSVSKTGFTAKIVSSNSGDVEVGETNCQMMFLVMGEK